MLSGMCGFVGIVTRLGDEPTISDRALVSMRDRLAQRGPDGSGLLRRAPVALGFRRLAVVDPTHAGDQPMTTPDGRGTLVYNGELYHDQELRARLGALGVRFASSCDTEVVLHTLALFGWDGLDRLRGMYALAWLDGDSLTLARDPLGIKPLFYAELDRAGRREVVFASSIAAILEHPEIDPRPDPITISSYLTTIRTTLGRRTMFAGIHTLLPGESIRFDLSAPELTRSRRCAWDRLERPEAMSGESAVSAVRGAVDESVGAHLRADVPVCTLLSGGLDSSIIAAVAGRASDRPLRTYCSGALTDADDDDLAYARQMSVQLGSCHTEVPVSRAAFADLWPAMIASRRLPLSTPNEVAIYEVASRLRADGQVVALSGEGADELFGGYVLPTSRSAEFVASGGTDPGAFELDANAWIARSLKPGLLAPALWRAAECDETLVGTYRDTFAELADRAGPGDPLAVHLAFQRRVNLAGLLDRLDGATMLAGVEGRTPLADIRVAQLAESLPSDLRFGAPDAGRPESAASTKIVLRRAFGDLVPASILQRPKASFPLPFQSWVADRAGILRSSVWAREVFAEAALAAVASRPCELWHLAWPMINLTMWGELLWGEAGGIERVALTD